jgi:hypothetical protein
MTRIFRAARRRTLPTIAAALAALGAAAAAPAADEPIATVVAAADTTAAPRASVSVIPALFYSPETRLGAGAFMLRTFRPEGARADARPSSVTVGLIGTVEKQVSAFVSVDLYRRAEALRWVGLATGSYFPAKFYGIGALTPMADEEDYTPRTFGFQLQALPRLGSALRAGPWVDVQRLRLAAVEEGGLLATGDITGAAGGDAYGAGLVLQHDTRDNVFFPTRGWLNEASVVAYGGDFTWTRQRLDLRRYLPLGPRRTVALQALYVATNGQPPFTQLALLGGQNLLRGYYEGRDRDHHLAALQTEYRRPLGGGRWGAAVFAAGGAVGRGSADLALARARFAAGAGLRYQLNRDEGLNFRLDYGAGGGSTGVYFTATEAF